MSCRIDFRPRLHNTARVNARLKKGLWKKQLHYMSKCNACILHPNNSFTAIRLELTIEQDCGSLAFIRFFKIKFTLRKG